MDGRLRLTVTRLETTLCLICCPRDLVSRAGNMDETVISSSVNYSDSDYDKLLNVLNPC